MVREDVQGVIFSKKRIEVAFVMQILDELWI